jgi:hypothetical protein
MKRWVGLGVIADNLVNIGRAMANRSQAILLFLPSLSDRIHFDLDATVAKHVKVAASKIRIRANSKFWLTVSCVP